MDGYFQLPNLEYFQKLEVEVKELKEMVSMLLDNKPVNERITDRIDRQLVTKELNISTSTARRLEKSDQFDFDPIQRGQKVYWKIDAVKAYMKKKAIKPEIQARLKIA